MSIENRKIIKIHLKSSLFTLKRNFWKWKTIFLEIFAWNYHTIRWIIRQLFDSTRNRLESTRDLEKSWIFDSIRLEDFRYSNMTRIVFWKCSSIRIDSIRISNIQLIFDTWKLDFHRYSIRFDSVKSCLDPPLLLTKNIAKMYCFLNNCIGPFDLMP